MPGWPEIHLNDAIRHRHLTRYGVLHFAGPDARAFLQGQLSNDMALLTAGQPLLAGLHSPQGRVLALLRLWPDGQSTDGVLAALPRELLAGVMSQLRRFVLRSKVTIADAGAAWQLHGECDAQGRLQHRLRAATPATDAAAQAGSLDDAEWEALEVTAGLPEGYSATAGEFIAQMLNLDCIGAIAWSKGCYTGQEIIARSHYRGQVKRRMRCFACSSLPPVSGGIHVTTDGLRMQVVRSATLADGSAEVLGVAPLELKSVDERPLPYSLP